MAETPTAPVFRQMRTGVVFLGMRPADWGKLAALGVLCLALFYATGLITVNATVERHSYDITDEVVEYRAARDAAAQARDAMKKYGAQDISEIDLPASTREEAEKAAELGIGPDASDEEVAAMVPATQVEKVPLVGDVWRGLFLVALPVVGFLMLHFEAAFGTNMMRECSRFVHCLRAQHVYASDTGLLFEEARRA